MPFRRVRIRNIISGFISIFRWSLMAVIIGILCGVTGTLFWYAVNWSDYMLQGYRWLLCLLPAGGLFIVWMNRRLGTERLSTDSVLQAVHEGTKLPWQLAPAIFAGTVVTHFFGGSSGREGAAFQIGGTIGNRIAAAFHQNDYEIKVATMAGMAALFASIFGLPLTATIFVVLVISVGSFWHSAIYPVMIASYVAYAISHSFGVQKVSFAVDIPALSLSLFLRVGILAILGAFLSTILCDSLHDTEKLLKKWLPNPYVRVVLTGAVVSLLIFVTRNQAAGSLAGSAAAGWNAAGDTFVYSGAGSNLIRLAIEEGSARPWDFIMKLLLTVLTLSAGFKGGEVLPSFAIGATFGCIAGPLLGIPSSFAAAIGLLSVFGGASNSLIAPIFLGIEMFGAGGLHFYAITAILSYIMSGYAGFYYSQVIVYSKISPRRLDLHTNTPHDQRDDADTGAGGL